MNRRTLLGAVGTLGAAGLAGCLDDDSESLFQNPFSGRGLATPVPVELTNEGDNHYNVHLEAYDPEAQRETYDGAYTVVPNERVSAPHLDGIDQQLRVTRFGGDHGDDLVEQASITRDTQYVRIRIFDDDIEVEAPEGEGTAPDDDLPEAEEADDANDSQSAE
ncbi:hypothetical protein [Natrononativus amylolyticus]|uniref:hypothetical protein n=1 Tax=Natrononativus amylolyticus TaxID=2963434 RepID=UPI0020CD0E0B|nr:hypothetical protein [Natrononativus amylolyticus]